MSGKTAGLAGQVFDGPCCYVNGWDVAFQAEVARIIGLPSSAARRAALDGIGLADGLAMRRRYEREIKKLWGRK